MHPPDLQKQVILNLFPNLNISVRFFSTVSQLWSTLRRDPLWPPYSWPILPPWCWGRWQWPQLRPYQQLPPATLTSKVYQSHALPCRTNSGVQPTSTLFWRARWSLCKGEQAKTATCSPATVSSTGRQVRRGDGWSFIYIQGHHSCWIFLALTSRELFTFKMHVQHLHLQVRLHTHSFECWRECTHKSQSRVWPATIYTNLHL